MDDWKILAKDRHGLDEAEKVHDKFNQKTFTNPGNDPDNEPFADQIERIGTVEIPRHSRIIHDTLLIKR